MVGQPRAHFSSMVLFPSSSTVPWNHPEGWAGWRSSVCGVW